MAVDTKFLDSLVSGDFSAGLQQPSDQDASRSYLKQSDLKDIVALSNEERAADRATNENPAVKNELLKEIERAKDPVAKAALVQELKRQGGDTSYQPDPTSTKQSTPGVPRLGSMPASVTPENTRFKDYKLDNNPNFGGNAATADSGNLSVSKEIGAAIDSYQANLWAIPAAMGSDYALKAMQENKAASEQAWKESGAPQSFDEMEFGKNFGQYFAHMALQSAPYMLEFMASGFGVGSLAKTALTNTAKGVAEKAALEAVKMGATKEAAKKAGEAAAASYMGKVYTASGVAGSYPSALGDVLSNQHEQAGKFDLPTAAALAVPYAALNAAGTEGMAVRAAARGLPKSAIAKDGIAGFAGRAALTGAEAGVMEGSTETGQEVMNQLGRMAVDPNAKIDDKRALEAYKESFIAGALLGGVPGVATGGFRKAEDQAPAAQPPAAIPNAPLTSAVNQAQHVENQQQQVAVDDHRDQIINMLAQRDDLTERIAGLQNMIDRANPSSEDGQRVRAMQSDLMMRRDALVSQIDAAKAFYGADQMANIGPVNDPLILGSEQMARTYQVTQRLLDNPSALDPKIRSELLKGFAVLRNRTLPEATRIDAAINLISTMDVMANQRAEAAAGRADEREWNAFAEQEAASDQAAKAKAIDKSLANSGPKPLPDSEVTGMRAQLLDRVLATNPENPNRAFDRALRLEGFRDATFTKEEKEKIARFNELRSIQEDGVFSAPNEAGAFGIREKRPSAVAGRYQHIADMLSSGWQLANKHQLTGPNGEVYNLKGAGEIQFVRNKLNQKAGNGNQSPRYDSQGGTDQGDNGVGSAGANGPVPQGGGNGSGQANAIPDTDAPAGAVSEAEATGAGNQPNNSLARSRLTALEDPRIAKYADDLRSMAPDAGWAEEGGRLLIAPDGTKSRTKWIPRAEWFVAGMLNSPRASVEAVRKAIAGEPMLKPERLHVMGMMDWLDAQHLSEAGQDALGTLDAAISEDSDFGLPDYSAEAAAVIELEFAQGSVDMPAFLEAIGENDEQTHVAENEAGAGQDSSATGEGAQAGRQDGQDAPGAGGTGPQPEGVTPRRRHGAFESTADYTVDTEDDGDIDVKVGRLADGSVIIQHPDGIIEHNKDFAAGKSDEELLAYSYEPLGYRGAKKKNEGFGLTGQTNEEAAAEHAQQQAGEPGDITKEQADKERDAVPFSMQMQSQPKPQGTQVGLFTADGRPSVAAKQPETAKRKIFRDNKETGVREVHEVDAQDVAISELPDHQFFVFKDEEKGAYSLTEASTGLRVGIGETAEAAIANFKAALEKVGVETFAQRVADSQKITGADETKPAGTQPVAQRSFVRTYKTKSGKIGARIEKVVGPTGKVFYNYTGEWGAGSGHALAQMDKIESMWRKEKRGYTVVEAEAVAEPAADEVPFKDGKASKADVMRELAKINDQMPEGYQAADGSTGLELLKDGKVVGNVYGLSRVNGYGELLSIAKKLHAENAEPMFGLDPTAAPLSANQFSKDAPVKSPATMDEFAKAVEDGYRAHYDFSGTDGRTIWIQPTANGWTIRWVDDEYPGTTHTKGAAGAGAWDKLNAINAAKAQVEYRFNQWKPLAESAPSPVNASMRDTGAKAFADGLPRVTPEGIKGADKVRWLTGYDDAQKVSALSQQKTDTAPKASEQAAPVSQPENDKPAYADDAELQDALSHLGDVLGDVFGAKLNITGKQYGASDLLPAMSKVIELLIKKGFKSFRESVGAATNAMRGNANTKGFVDQITPRQWKAAYNSVAEFHDGTESEEDVAKYSAEQIAKIIALPEKIKEAEQATNHDATPGQKEAGNYAKGKFAWHGLNIAVETAKGEDRTDKETNGEKWRVTMPATYGYILGTVGADKDHVDVFIGDKPESQRVYVVNQTKPGSTKFDEHKIMLGYESEGAAIGDYLLSFSDTFGASVLGSVSGPYTIEQFKEMLAADRFKKAKPLDSNIAYVNPRMEKAETVKPKDALNKVAKTIGVANGYSADLFDGYHSYQDFSAAADSAESIKYKPAGTWMVAGWVSDNGDTNYIGFESLGGGKWRATGSIQGSIDAALEPKNVEPGTRTNGTKEKAAAERLAQLLDKMDQVRIDRNTPEGSAKGIVRSVIEELRKERTAVSVVELLETASQRLLRQHAPFSEVIDQVVESLRSDASPDNKGDIKQAGVSLDKFGLTVRRSQTKNGTPTWEVSGNTRDHVAVLRNAGGKWYGPKKVWSFFSEESPEGRILAALGASPAASGVALSDIEVERKSEGTGRIKTYKQRADEALSEIDERMSLGKQLLECLNS